MNPNQNTPNPEMPPTEPPIIPPQQNEIPVQNEQQPIAAEPVAQQPIETVVQPPIQNVVPDMQTLQPIQSQQEVVQPVTPVNPTTETVLGAQPQAVVGSPLITAPVPIKKSKLKWLITIAVAIVVLSGTAVSAWFLAPSLFNVGPPLKEHSFALYSISVPESYELKPGSPDAMSGVYFTKTIGDVGDNGSAVNVMVVGVELTKSRVDMEKQLDSKFTETEKDNIIDYLGWNGYIASKYSSNGVSIDKYKKNGASVYYVAGKYSYTDGNISGPFSSATFVNDTKYAQIYINANKSDIDISADSKRIIESFKFK